jgi:hypothetical protein
MNPFKPSSKFTPYNFRDLSVKDLVDFLMDSPLPTVDECDHSEPSIGITGEDSSHRDYSRDYVERDGYVFHHLTIMERKPVPNVVDVLYQDMCRQRRRANGHDVLSSRDKKELKEEATNMASIDAPVTHSACPITWVFQTESSGYVLIGETNSTAAENVAELLLMRIGLSLSLSASHRVLASNEPLRISEEVDGGEYDPLADFLLWTSCQAYKQALEVAIIAGSKGKLKLISPGEGAGAKEITLAKGCPMLSSELYFALQHNKRLMSAEITIAPDDAHPITFEYNAAANSYASVKVELPKKGLTTREAVDARVDAVEEAINIMVKLQTDYQSKRLSSEGTEAMEEEIKEWVADGVD